MMKLSQRLNLSEKKMQIEQLTKGWGVKRVTRK